jgi:hypothetical protein
MMKQQKKCLTISGETQNDKLFKEILEKSIIISRLYLLKMLRK